MRSSEQSGGATGGGGGRPIVPAPHFAKARLNLPGRLVLAAVFVTGVACSVWLGLWVGAILGLNAAEPLLNAPAKGVGLAPDLSGLAAGAWAFFGNYAAGIVVGLVAGLAVMGLVSRFALRPILCRIPALSRRGR
jgi:hypothetical protein